MTTRILGGGPESPYFRTANDAFKAGWSTQLYWSTVIAVSVHAVLLLWSPSWDQAHPASEEEPTGIQLVSVRNQPEEALGGEGFSLSVVPEAEADELEHPEDPGLDDGTGGSGGEVGSRPGTLRAQLRGRGAPVPTIVEPEPDLDEAASEEDSEDPDSNGGLDRIAGSALLSDYEDALSGDGGPNLGRLSAFRPELALHTPSDWILLRNPIEVGDFLRRRFRGPEIDSGPPGLLTVAIWIDERGSVEWAEIHRSSGRPELDESALELFQEVASFRPAREQGVHVPMAVVFGLSYPW